jgi:hypothetical protein
MSGAVHDLPIAGMSVTRCLIDAAFSVELYSAEYVATIRIESPFTVSVDAVAMQLTPTSPTTLGPALRLLNSVVNSCTFDDSGRLRVEAGVGLWLEVSAGDGYEAWQFSDTKGRGVVALPSGGIDSWGPALAS